MPLTEYTYRNQKLLESFAPTPNFSENSFTFYNRESGKVIVDAIRIDQDGNVIFKDEKVELYLKDIVGRARSVDEDVNENGLYSLYFSDKFNRRHSLGEIYKLLFQIQPKNVVYWFAERASRKLSDGMDLTLTNNYIKSSVDLNIDDLTETITNIELADTWKNKWIDIPCLEVITPDYIDGVYASISATINFKIKTDKPIVTGFRIYDATAGIELMRVIHASERSPGKYVSYAVPLHYQGPLPDTPQSSENNYTGLTYKDLQNIQIKEGVEKGKDVSKNPEQYEVIPETQHVIKLQWITCDLAVELDNLGAIVGDFGRYFEPTGDTSLDVTLYNSSLNKNKVIQLNGSIDTNSLEEGTTTYTQSFDIIPLGLEKDYTISFTTNKNINISLIQKDTNGFVIQWYKPVRGLEIDWGITYRITEDDYLDLEKINDPQRSLNHYLFLDKKFATDFCNEVTDIEGVETFVGNRETIFITDEFQPDCFCCDCCDDLYPSVTFKLVTGNTTRPTCDNDLFTFTYDLSANEGSVISGGSGGIAPPSDTESNVDGTFLVYGGTFEGGVEPVFSVGNSQYFTLDDVEELAGLKTVASLVGTMSGSPDRFKPDHDNEYLTQYTGFIVRSNAYDNTLVTGYVKYSRNSDGNIIYYEATDDYGNIRFAPDPSYFRYEAILGELSNEDASCRVGLYANPRNISDHDMQYVIENGFGDSASSERNFDITYDTFIGFDTQATSISADALVYSSAVALSGFGSIHPFFRGGSTYYVTFRMLKNLSDPIISLFEHTVSSNIGSQSIVGLPGTVHLFRFWDRQPDPNSTDGKDFVVFSWTPSEDVQYADLHFTDLNIISPIELVSIGDTNPLIPEPFAITNNLISRDLINKREEFIEQFPLVEQNILKYNILSGEIGLTTTLPLSANPCGGAYTILSCSLATCIDGIMNDVERLSKLRTIYGQTNIKLELEGTVTPTLTDAEQGTTISDTSDFVLLSQMTVGAGETVVAVKVPLVSCTEVIPASSANTIQDELNGNEIFGDGWTRGSDKVVGDGEGRAVQKMLTYEDIYGRNLLFTGLDFADQVEFDEHLAQIANAYEIGLDVLKYEKRANSYGVAAQYVSSKIINFNNSLGGDSILDGFQSFGSILEASQDGDGNPLVYLRVNSPTALKTITMTYGGFLGVRAFGNNILIFDPYPNVMKTPNQRPIFPGYDPIGQKRTLEEIRKHIYTTVYPSRYIPIFPNFIVGNVAINGAIYNPLFDWRNWRLSGYYDSDEVYKSFAMANINSNYVSGTCFKIGNSYFMLMSNPFSSGPIYTSKFGNTYQKVKPSTLEFVPIRKDVYDLNVGRRVEI